MRKDAGFEVVDKIHVFYKTDSEEIKKAFASSNIKKVVLAENISSGESDGFSKELDIYDYKVIVSVVKV